MQRAASACRLVVIVLLAWTIAYRANSELMQQMLLPVVAILAVYAACGWQICRLAAAPLAYLYFGIPLWEQLLPFLQALTTAVAENLLGLMGVPTQVASTTISSEMPRWKRPASECGHG